MIKTLYLRFGRGPDSIPETVSTTPVTVFVGPNNSGKSKVLQEIRQICMNGNQNPANLVLKTVDFLRPNQENIEKYILTVTQSHQLNSGTPPEHIYVGKLPQRFQVDREQYKRILADPNRQASDFCRMYLQFRTLMLDGQSRIGLTNSQSFGDLQQPSQNSFQTLFRDDNLRKEVRRIIFDAFGTNFVIDPGQIGSLRIRLSQKPPSNNIEERGIHAEAVNFHAQAILIEECSDGVKAFTGIITEIIAGNPQVLLIDEPEAFLHPSLAFNLGTEITRMTSDTDKRIFVSTHSPQFVMGCIRSGAPVSIVRLTYRNGTPTARVLKNEDILKLMRNPLLRSTNVISGLFYEFVVVTEADADRAFYQEINDRLQRITPSLGIPNCLFLNAQNKQTIPTILGPLRELGIPAAGIVDIDLLKEGGAVWANMLKSINIPEIERVTSGNTRATLNARFSSILEKSKQNMKTHGGINLLDDDSRESAKNLFERLAEYGLFVVERGELETWLKPLGVNGHGPNWLIEIFEKMGEDPDRPGYVGPEKDDVWAFVCSVKKWLTNELRKGIPT